MAIQVLSIYARSPTCVHVRVRLRQSKVTPLVYFLAKAPTSTKVSKHKIFLRLLLFFFFLPPQQCTRLTLKVGWAIVTTTPPGLPKETNQKQCTWSPQESTTTVAAALITGTRRPMQKTTGLAQWYELCTVPVLVRMVNPLLASEIEHALVWLGCELSMCAFFFFFLSFFLLFSVFFLRHYS